MDLKVFVERQPWWPTFLLRTIKKLPTVLYVVESMTNTYIYIIYIYIIYIIYICVCVYIYIYIYICFDSKFESNDK